MSAYRVTALKDVTIRAFVRGHQARQVGDQVMMAPSEREEWVSLRAGDVRGGLGIVLGVHPRCAPERQATHVKGVAVVFSEGDAVLPVEVFGLYRVEVEAPAPE